MKNNWTIKDLEQKVKAGKLKGYVVKAPQPQKDDVPPGRRVGKHFNRKSKAKDYIASGLLQWCRGKGYALFEEYRFHETRKWRFDWAVPAIMTAIEFEGSIHNPNGDHRSVKGISRDMEKYNSAALLGWKVLRFSSLNYETLIEELNKLP